MFKVVGVGDVTFFLAQDENKLQMNMSLIQDIIRALQIKKQERII